MLSPRHHALLLYIDRQLKETGRPPSFEEMKDAVKARSMSSVYRAISTLGRNGFISRRRGRLREIVVVRLPEDGADGVLTGQTPRMATGLDVLTRARELVGEVVWPKLSIRTQASILHAEALAMDLGTGTRPRAEMWRDSPEVVTTSGTQPPDLGPSLQALRMATDAVRRGYGLTEATRHPAIVAQAIELSFLLVSYGLVPGEPGTPMSGSGKTGADTVRNLPPELRTAATIERAPHASHHILVVDDVSDVLVSVTAFLVGAGFVVTTATDGDMALRLLATDPKIGVLVTDFVMPGMSGTDLILQAKQLRPGVKALLITGYPSAVGLAELPPGVEVLAKPFRRTALIERVSVLAREVRTAASDTTDSTDGSEPANVIG